MMLFLHDRDYCKLSTGINSSKQCSVLSLVSHLGEIITCDDQVNQGFVTTIVIDRVVGEYAFIMSSLDVFVRCWLVHTKLGDKLTTHIVLLLWRGHEMPSRSSSEQRLFIEVNPPLKKCRTRFMISFQTKTFLLIHSQFSLTHSHLKLTMHPYIAHVYDVTQTFLRVLLQLSRVFRYSTPSCRRPPPSLHSTLWFWRPKKSPSTTDELSWD